MTKNQFWKGSTFFVLFSFDLTQEYVGHFRHFVCVLVIVAVFVIVFVYVSSYDFLAFIISFQKMYGYWGL